MEDLEIRLFMMNPVLRQRVDDLRITSGDDELMMLISMGLDTSSKIAEAKDCAVLSISGRLSRLRSKGYIARENIRQASGGYEFVYKNIYEIKD